MLTMNRADLYRACKEKDIRFDGRFFIANTLTNKYCRPICQVELPVIENCIFYPRAEEADRTGYSPCLLCRPKLAPGSIIANKIWGFTQEGVPLLDQNAASKTNISLSLTYKAPYRWSEILSFLAGRAIYGVELVSDEDYKRTVRILDEKQEYIKGWVKIGHKPKEEALTVTVSQTLLPVLAHVLAKIRQMFDLYCDPEEIYKILAPMNKMHPNICVLGTRLPGSFDVFEMSVRAILGQQITVKAASTLTKRFVEAFGRPSDGEIPGLTHFFPLAEDILAIEESIEDRLGSLGIMARRSRAILELAKVIHQGSVNFNFSIDPEAEIEKLLAIPGIGNWTAQYIAMRTMGWTDAFMATDAGIKKALQQYSAKELLDLAEEWRPWRSYAMINLWNSLSV